MKKNPKENPKENTDCMRYESQGCTGIRVVWFVVTNYCSGLTWPGCCWCCWWSERVETFQKTQYILCMGWRWR